MNTSIWNDIKKEIALRIEHMLGEILLIKVLLLQVAGIAKVLASHGSKVMIVDLNGDSAKKVAKEINSLFPRK